jgi:methylglyoxal synthase
MVAAWGIPATCCRDDGARRLVRTKLKHSRRMMIVLNPAARSNEVQMIRVPMDNVKNIILIAHDQRKNDLLEWVKYNRDVLKMHNLFATGTTGELIARGAELDVTRFRSGPLGGDQQIGAKISDGDVDILIFFWDPLMQQSHDPDVKALLRIAVVYNVPTACNRATADFLVASPLFHGSYERRHEDYSTGRADPDVTAMAEESA